MDAPDRRSVTPRPSPHPQELIRHGRSRAEKRDLEEIVVLAPSGTFLLRPEHPNILTGGLGMGHAQAFPQMFTIA
jgi:hypothetical protein